MHTDDLQQIAQDAEDANNIYAAPDMVPGRILVADGDVLSYKACDLEESYAENVAELKHMINIWKTLAGAEYVELHVSLGTKGGREQIAKLKKYQGNRDTKDPDKQERVKELRLYMSETHSEFLYGVPQYEQEADDSMTQAMIKYGKRAIMMTVDKDLNMVPGLRLDTGTFDIFEQPDGYGKCWMGKTNGGTPKLKGMGTSFFWHQLLMGDSADDIPGLPRLHKNTWIKYCPTKKVADLQRRMASGRMPSGKLMTASQRRKTIQLLSDVIREADGKPIGAVLAHRYLSTCNTNKTAYLRCLEAYREFYGDRHTFYSWDNVLHIDVSPEDMMLEQARLLWMRRVKGEDVKDWLEDVSNDRNRI